MPIAKSQLRGIKTALKAKSSAKRAATNAWFFKTGPGEYGEGDKFIGLSVPDIRKVAMQFADLSRADLKQLLSNPIHEHRLCALLILVTQFEPADKDSDRKSIYDFYLKNLKHVNNWDLVDSSADKIVGAYLYDHKSQIKPALDRLIKTKHLWSERVAIIATYHFIKHNEFGHTIRLAKHFLTHQHDLIHKAVGWMLREVGKRDQAVLTKFLNAHSRQMPRTMLRYSIERLPKAKRQAYLTGKI